MVHAAPGNAEAARPSTGDGPQVESQQGQPSCLGEPIASSAASVLAWDLPTRLFKWALVGCVAAAWLTNKFAVDRPYLHVWNGYLLLVLLVFRLLWGMVGGTTSRFSAFVTGPWTASRFLAAQLRGRARPYLGHSPASAQVVIALLAALALQAGLGLYAADPDRLIVEGPLAATIGDGAVQRMASLHRLGFQFILVLATVHIAANLLYAAFTEKGLITAMITGRKARATYQDAAEARPGSLKAAIACLICSVVLVFGTILVLGGHFGN